MCSSLFIIGSNDGRSKPRPYINKEKKVQTRAFDVGAGLGPPIPFLYAVI